MIITAFIAFSFDFIHFLDYFVLLCVGFEVFTVATRIFVYVVAFGDASNAIIVVVLDTPVTCFGDKVGADRSRIVFGGQ